MAGGVRKCRGSRSERRYGASSLASRAETTVLILMAAAPLHWEGRMENEGRSRLVVPEKVQEEMKKIEMRKPNSRTEALTPNFTDTEIYKRNQPCLEERQHEQAANAETRPLIIQDTSKSAPWYIDSFETPREVPRAAAPVPDR